MKRIGLLCLSLALSGCALGVVTMRPDGSCEARGLALGRAELAAYRPQSVSTYNEDPNTETRSESELCARVGGGSGSASWWGFVGALVGAIAAALPALL